MTMDFGAGSNDLADAESAAQGTASQLAEPVRDLHLGGLRDDGPDTHRGHQRRRHRVLHLERLVAGELRRLQRRRGALLLGGRRLRQGDRLPVLVDLQPDHRWQRRHAPPPPGSGPITGYQGLCLDDRSASTANFNPIQVYTCNGTSAQQWTVDSNNTLQVLGKCLDVNAAGTANGTTVDLYDCNGTGAQTWVPQSNGDLLNPESGKCLDDTGFGGSGTQVQIWSCTGSSNQAWKLP